VALAQDVRVTGITSLQGLDIRPLREDSVPVTQTTGTGPVRQLSNGRLVRCVEGESFCRFRTSGDRETIAPVIQDLHAVAWGFGQGISLQGHVRVRGSLSSADARWPRADDAFDAIEGWLEVDRGPARTRIGRQWVTGGLGVYNYDGASVLLRRGRMRLEAFGGRSLVAGLNDPIAGSELGSVDDLPPDEHGWLIGFSGSAPLSTRGNVAATWQRVIRADRAALYSDRVAATGVWRLYGTTADVSFAGDLTAEQVNELRVRLSRALRPAVTGGLEVRRYRPFFEAWTIWGAFSPVAFDELQATAGWRAASGALALDVRGARRRYEETHAGLESVPLRNDGWRAGAGIEWLPDERWLLHTDYDVDIGFGASQSDFVAGARWMPDNSQWVGLSTSALQHIYEFRLGTGRIVGVRADAGTRLGSNARLVGDLAWYAHHFSGSASSPDWSQRRFSVRVEWTVGGDPGLSRRSDR
jgi:hypothetical protein